MMNKILGVIEPNVLTTDYMCANAEPMFSIDDTFMGIHCKTIFPCTFQYIKQDQFSYDPYNILMCSRYSIGKGENNMKDYKDKVCEQINLYPGDRFIIMGPDSDDDKIYTLKPNMIVECDDGAGIITDEPAVLAKIICGDVKIKKIKKLTYADKVAIIYARALNYNWIAKTLHGDTFCCRLKPQRPVNGIGWIREDEYSIIGLDISCVNIDDDEPLYVGNIDVLKILEEIDINLSKS